MGRFAFFSAWVPKVIGKLPSKQATYPTAKMLPKLSTKRSVTFGPVVAEPAYISARRNALVHLKNISDIRVSGATKGRDTRYAVDVFVEPLDNRLTTNTSSTMSSGLSTSWEIVSEEPHSLTPTVRIERTLEEFIDLRDTLYRTIFTAHHRQYCKFCSEVLDPVISGEDPGGFFFAFFGENMLCGS
ncbi:unnamed protein product [Phytophthora lilii]|uniref:Unnamed protein product n=1 Tax=Phytophthora lilii TaxID=2077276 RepID=A0A9W6TL39_9STRA|nr:unnamed protein product [Phytophthora lilii]